jgi:hypothetical protein
LVANLQPVNRSALYAEIRNDLIADQSSGDDELPVVSTKGKACCDIGGVPIKLGRLSGLEGVSSKDRAGIADRDGEDSMLPIGVALTLRTQVGCVDSA